MASVPAGWGSGTTTQEGRLPVRPVRWDEIMRVRDVTGVRGQDVGPGSLSEGRLRAGLGQEPGLAFVYPPRWRRDMLCLTGAAGVEDVMWVWVWVRQERRGTLPCTWACAA